jgi:D-methionine transport system permease protein
VIDLSIIDWQEIGQATLETITMTGVALLFTVVFGLCLGIALFLTGSPGFSSKAPRARTHARAREQELHSYAAKSSTSITANISHAKVTSSKQNHTKEQIKANGYKPRFETYNLIYRILSFVVNVLRSIPFLILLIVLLPFTLWLTGTSLGVQGAIPPLVIGTTPFFARLVENVLREIDKGIIEACQAMGARVHQIILALLPEALPGLIGAITVTAITLMSYAAMSGVIGGGGLGDLAIRYGYQRFQVEIMLVTIAILVVLVQLLQYAGDYLVRYFSRK